MLTFPPGHTVSTKYQLAFKLYYFSKNYTQLSPHKLRYIYQILRKITKLILLK